LDHKIHRLSAADYATALQETLSEYEVSLAQTAAERKQVVSEATVVTGYQISEELAESTEGLSFFICPFADTNRFPIDTLESNGVTVESATGFQGPNVTEQALEYILTFVCRLDHGWRQEQQSTWSHYQTGELSGSVATVVGQGPIGRTIVDRLDAFDVTKSAFDIRRRRAAQRTR
jgi:Phosphoglycerate dehydrogenase and related dehydrogenases